ncbi:hypothetical protein Tco_0242864 [Tanacetum coccineum]
MTSNSVESVNALTKDVRKLPITSLMEWFRDLLQKWYYERRAKHQDAPDDELTEWATAKVKRRMLKSANWTVKGVHESKVYEIREHKKIHVVYLEKGLHSVAQLAKPWFLNRQFKGTYTRIIYPVRDVSSWHTPDDFPLLLLLILGKNLPGRPKKKDRIPSQVTQDMVDYVNEKYGTSWLFNNEVSDEILDDLLKRVYENQQRVKDDKAIGTEIIDDVMLM